VTSLAKVDAGQVGAAVGAVGDGVGKFVGAGVGVVGAKLGG